jgi:recombination protein RecA
VRLDIRRIGGIKDGEEVVGNRCRVKVVKNMVAPPFKMAEFDVVYGSGISREGLLVDLGVDARVIEKSGAWYSYGETRLGQGRENAKQFLKDNPDIAEEVESQLKVAMGIVKSAGAGDSAAEESEEAVGAEAE